MVRRDCLRVRCWADRSPAVIEDLSAARLKCDPCTPILMCAHRKSHSLGVFFANNKPDAARRATSEDDAVLISGEPEARDIGGRDPGRQRTS